MIAFKIRTKSSHLVKWKPIQLFYTTATIHLTHAHTHTRTPTTCSMLVISYSETSGVSWCSLIGTFLWIFLCVVFLLILTGLSMNVHFTSADWNCFWNFFVSSFDKLSHPGNVLFRLEKSKSKWEKRTQIGQKETDHFASYPNCLSLFFLYKSKLNTPNLGWQNT